MCQLNGCDGMDETDITIENQFLKNEHVDNCAVFDNKILTK